MRQGKNSTPGHRADALFTYSPSCDPSAPSQPEVTRGDGHGPRQKVIPKERPSHAVLTSLLCAKRSPEGLDSMGNKIWIPPSRDNTGKKPKPLLEEVRKAAPL